MPFKLGVDFQDKSVFSLPRNTQKRICLWLGSTSKDSNSRNHCKNARHQEKERLSQLNRIKQMIIINHVLHLYNTYAA